MQTWTQKRMKKWRKTWTQKRMKMWMQTWTQKRMKMWMQNWKKMWVSTIGTRYGTNCGTKKVDVMIYVKKEINFDAN